MANVWPLRVPDVQLYAGDTWEQIYRFETAGEPADLSSWTGWACQARKSTGSGVEDVALDLSGLAEGVIVLALTAEQTRRMRDTWVFDVQAERDGRVRTFLRGRSSWLLDITREE